MHICSDGDDKGESGIEFEGVHIDDDPNAGMVVMRGFFFLQDTITPPPLKPIFRIEKTSDLADSSSNDISIIQNNLTATTNKSARRVTLFEGLLFVLKLPLYFMACLTTYAQPF